jgi:outer membrane lipoprotein carrier protein
MWSLFRKFSLAMLVFCIGGAGLAAAAGDDATLSKILDGLENRYAGPGFSAKFFQESMLKAMQISDTAEGKLTVKRPGKMRWEYTIPDVQTVVSDGRTMWIYRPADNQVMVGKAPSFFAGGKGAGGEGRRSQQDEELCENSSVHQWVNLSGSGLVLARGLRKYRRMKNAK